MDTVMIKITWKPLIMNLALKYLDVVSVTPIQVLNINIV